MNFSDFVTVFVIACLRFRSSWTSSASLCWYIPGPRLVNLQRDLLSTALLPPTLQTRLPFCSFPGLTCAPPERGQGRLLTQRTRVCHRPSISTAADSLLPHPQHPVRLRQAGQAGRTGGAADPKVSPALLRHRGVRRQLMGGSRSGHASVGSRARSSARWGSRGRTGRGGAGRGRKRPRRDYETRPAESRAHSPARDGGGAALC